MGHNSVLMMLSALIVASPALQMGLANPEQAARNPATASQWLEKAASTHNHPRETGCWRRPWVCQEERGRFQLPFGRKACCNNRCVDVSSDANSCGACGVRCPFSWTCCNGVCIDPKTNPFHCGACNNRCAIGSVCSHGMCGYAQQQPPPLPHIPFPRPCEHSLPQQPPHKHP
ncbi:hypothetical protein Taro_015321 [Colocasia esculenta]|uniref:Stigma-specific Stig1 family protein n=1 Tax=Colocasia esculenta TaxID=4460 RepID=A0A843UPJ1_COLES|nr:hypothetical protein [Colocasia esculenta]